MRKIGKAIAMMAIIMQSFSLVQASSIEINYEGSFKDCVSEQDVLSFSFDELQVPGDTVSDGIYFVNMLDHEVELYLKIEEDDVFEECEVIIYKNDEEIANQSVSDIADLEYYSLGTYDTDEICELTFMISVPTSLDNEYTFASGSIQWTLGLVEEYEAPNTGVASSTYYLLVTALTAGAFVILYKGGKKHEMD